MASTKFLVTFSRTTAGSISGSDVWESGGNVEVWQGRVPVIHDMKTLRAYTDGDETLEKADVMAFLPPAGFRLVEIGDVASWQENGKYKQGTVLGLQGTARIALIEAHDVSDPLALTLGFITVPVKVATSGEIYSYTALAENPGGSAPVVTVVSKPAWMTEAAVTNGVLLEGTPAAGDVGSGTVQLKAEADGRTVYQSFTVAVASVDGFGLPAPDVYSLLQGNADGDAWEVVKKLVLEESGRTLELEILEGDTISRLLATGTAFSFSSNIDGGFHFLQVGPKIPGDDVLKLSSFGVGTLFRVDENGHGFLLGNIYAENTDPMSEAEAQAGVATDQRTISSEVLKAAIDALASGGEVVTGTLEEILLTSPSAPTVGVTTDVGRVVVYLDQWYALPDLLVPLQASHVGAIPPYPSGYGPKSVYRKGLVACYVSTKGADRVGAIKLGYDAEGIAQFLFHNGEEYQTLPYIINIQKTDDPDISLGAGWYRPVLAHTLYMHSKTSVERNAVGEPVVTCGSNDETYVNIGGA